MKDLPNEISPNVTYQTIVNYYMRIKGDLHRRHEMEPARVWINSGIKPDYSNELNILRNNI